jgi:CRISPR-associated endonuclease/helicase Cas3
MLTTDRFSEYFRVVHECTPFPWQQRLLNQVAETGTWPVVLSLPTGAGKTAILDIAVFALACGAATPRRTVLVVDRRVVVDDAYRRAERIRAAICSEEATRGRAVLGALRESLLDLGGESPLEVALLRGGMYLEDTWVRHPAQPLLVCSTVDQAGSRILHQGYGVSPHMRSVHAGLLANDCLIVLDEAHCSEPFRQTLEWIAKYRHLGESPIPTPFSVVTMTATPKGAGRVYGLDAADRRDPVLAKRLKARKQLFLRTATRARDDGFIAEVISVTRDLVAHRGKTVLVVVNRVATARRIAEGLAAAMHARRDALQIEEPVLLTGRSRPLERDAILEAAAARLYCGRDRLRYSDRPSFVVVATQCVEVGADLDVDVLVSEACPLDSLRQRLGRLDRLGELGNTQAFVVAPKELAESAEEEPPTDPIYGAATGRTWRWLSRIAQGDSLAAGTVDLDKHLAEIDAAQTGGMQAPSADAPLVFPAYCDLWVQTSPEPAVVPEPAAFLHGVQRGEPEVQLLWRADLPIDRPETWNAVVSACPPVAGEALRVPLLQARKWLQNMNQEAQSDSDLEGESIVDDRLPRDGGGIRSPFLLWRGTRTKEPSDEPLEIVPGDTIVLPASVGGCDPWGWAPEKTEPVADVADRARWKGGRPAVLRLHPDCLAGWPLRLRDLPMEQTDDVSETIEQKVQEAVAGIDPKTVDDPERRAALSSLRGSRRIRIEHHPSGSGWIVTGEGRGARVSTETSDEDDSASRLSRQVRLDEHLRHVEAVMRDHAKALGLSRDLVEDLALAAGIHDVGKGDPRFQSLLWGGDRIAALQAGLLAKSPRMGSSKTSREGSLQRSGYPVGGRHELLSVRLAESDPEIRRMAHDWDLVLHLIASHHGRCRPFAPIVVDAAPRAVSVPWKGRTLRASSDTVSSGTGLDHAASGVAERFWVLVRRYGWWGLSYLEACFRLADHRASENEESEEQP